MKARIITCFIFFLIGGRVCAQDTVYARKIIDTLTSSYYHGRGYTNDGLFRAMQFLNAEFTNIGLKPMRGKSFIQPLSYSINYFPGEMVVVLNGDTLRPGYDFIVSGNSRKLSGDFRLDKSDSTSFIHAGSNLVVTVVEKLTASVSTKVSDSTKVMVLRSSVKSDPASISLKIENRFDDNYKTSNICGYVKGKKKSDSLIVFTAHYDHLGGMGKDIFFPGANDNASGVSLVLSLAKYYVENPQSYSIGFILFTGEEAGLLGSDYFVKHPLVHLKSIRMLINLDLTGTGEEGITVVNATKFEKDFNLLVKINEEEKLLAAVNPRGKAKNSDHHYFTEKGIPSFFIYTLGGIKAYHDVHDVSETLPNNEAGDLSLLLRKFAEALMKGKKKK